MSSNSKVANKIKEEGNEAYRAGNLEKAIELYTKAIQIDPTNHLLYSNRAAANMKTLNYGAAIPDLHKCLEISPKFQKAYVRLTYSYLMVNDIEKSRQINAKAKTIWPDFNIQKTVEGAYSNSKNFDGILPGFDVMMNKMKNWINEDNFQRLKEKGDLFKGNQEDMLRNCLNDPEFMKMHEEIMNTKP